MRSESVQASKGRSVRLSSKALLAGAGASLPLAALLAQPAAAAVSSATEDFTFVRGGEEVTCTIFASSVLNYDSDEDRTTLAMETRMSDTEAACRDAVIATHSGGFYQEPDGSNEVVEGFSESHHVSTQWAEAGQVTSFTVQHEVYFRCDDAVSCVAELETSPK